jgi:hypothetical protein
MSSVMTTDEETEVNSANGFYAKNARLVSNAFLGSPDAQRRAHDAHATPSAFVFHHNVR